MTVNSAQILSVICYSKYLKLKGLNDPGLALSKGFEWCTPCKSDGDADEVDRDGSLVAPLVTLLLRKKRQRNTNLCFTIKIPSTK